MCVISVNTTLPILIETNTIFTSTLMNMFTLYMYVVLIQIMMFTIYITIIIFTYNNNIYTYFILLNKYIRT